MKEKGINDLTLMEVMALFIYRPYKDPLIFMVDEDQRIFVTGQTWTVILNHNTGEFNFSGELNRYYDIDTIESIRDTFGDIYSVFNIKYDTIQPGVWYTISTQEKGPSKYDITYQDADKKRSMLEHKKSYYWANREKILSRNRANYKRKKEKS